MDTVKLMGQALNADGSETKGRWFVSQLGGVETRVVLHVATLAGNGDAFAVARSLLGIESQSLFGVPRFLQLHQTGAYHHSGSTLRR